MQALSILFNNLLGFDSIILLLALFNGIYILPRIRHIAKKLGKQLKPTIYVPIESILKSINSPNKQNNKSIDLYELRSLRDKQNFFYNIHLTINSIFPMLGILGTVLSLLRLVNLEDTQIMFNFSTALTSTFWGLVFAILFRILDGFISAKIEENESDFILLINRIDEHTKGDSKGDANEA